VSRLFQWIQNLFSERPTVPQSGSTGSHTLATTPTVIAVYVRIQATDPLRQSEILTDVIQKRQSLQSLGTEKPVLEEIRHPYAIVATQDCDLEQDFNARKSQPSTDKSVADKLIPNVLLLEAISVTELLANLSGSDIRKRVRQNKDERYHVLQKVEARDDAEGAGLPSLGVDFKRFFTVPTDELYVQLRSNAKRRTCLASSYLEHLSNRFAAFQSRVALPVEHKID
jgi:hypothetical protein